MQDQRNNIIINIFCIEIMVQNYEKISLIWEKFNRKQSLYNLLNINK